MDVIYTGQAISFKWKICRNASEVPEDFSKADLQVFFIGNDFDGNYDGKYWWQYSSKNDGGYITVTIPADSLSPGTYCCEALWIKNRHQLLDAGSTRTITRARKDRIFKVSDVQEECTDYDSESSSWIDEPHQIIVNSGTTSYGYDGMSAYETAVFNGLYAEDWGDIPHSERAWIAEYQQAEERVNYQMDESHDGSVPGEPQSWANAELKRKQAEGQLGDTDPYYSTSRRKKESDRQTAETSRGTAETQRQKNEGQLGDTDPDYATSRIKKENDRQTAESGRASAESGRVSAENTRVQNEGSGGPSSAGYSTSRIKKELDRQAAETQRQTNEGIGATDAECAAGSRRKNESIRQANEARRQAQEGSATDSPDASGSRWARYKYNEGTDAGSEAGDASRWGKFKEQEGTLDSSEADDGSRWGQYKEEEGTEDSSYTEHSRWGNYQAAEITRGNDYSEAEGSADGSTSGDGSRWGSYKLQEGANTDAASASGSRWARYKKAENDRETAYGTAEGSATDSPSASGSRWARFNKAQADRDQAVAPSIGYYSCATAASTAAKEVSATNYELASGGSIKIKFTYANSASSPTLNINSEGAKAIVYNGAAASASNTWAAGDVVEFYYDPTYNSNAGAYVGIPTVVSVSQNTETGKEELIIGGTPALIVDNVPEVNSNNLAKSGSVNLIVNEIPLYQGQTNGNGNITTHPNKVTTGPIATYGQKLYIANSNNECYISIRYGDSATSLPTEVAKVSKYGEPYVFDITSAKYIAVQIIATAETTPADNRLTICPLGAIKQIEDTQDRFGADNLCLSELFSGSVRPLLPIIQGVRSADGYNSANATTRPKNIVTNIFRIDGTYRIKCDSAYKMFIKYKADGTTSFVESATRLTEYLLIGKGYADIVFRKADETQDIIPSDFANIKLTIEYVSSYNISSAQWTIPGGDAEQRFNSQQVLKAGVKYKLAFASTNFQFNEAPERVVLYGMTANANVGTIRYAIKNVVSTDIGTSIEYTPQYDLQLFASCNIAAGSYLDIAITPIYDNLNKFIRQHSSSIYQTKSVFHNLISDMFTQGATISDIYYRLAISDGCAINDDGWLAVGYCAKRELTEESGHYDACLSICNIADIEGTKKIIKIWEVGQTYNGLYISNSTHIGAGWTGDSEVTLYGLVSYYEGNVSKLAVLAVTYNTETEIIGNPTLCDINVLGTTYDMNCGDDYATTFNAIWSATNMEHPLGRSGLADYRFFPAGSPIKIGNYYYMSMVCGNFAHPLLKTQDFVHWTYVCDIPHSDGLNDDVYSPSEEVYICYYNGKVYAITRGNKVYVDPSGESVPDGIQCWNTILSCDLAKLEDRDEDDWSVQVFENYAYERSTIVGINGNIYALMGTLSSSTNAYDGVSITRQRKAVMIFDTELNMISQTIMSSNIPYMHPIFLSRAGNILAVTSTDKRGLSYCLGANSRAEIIVSTLNPELLQLMCN